MKKCNHLNKNFAKKTIMFYKIIIYKINEIAFTLICINQNQKDYLFE